MIVILEIIIYNYNYYVINIINIDVKTLLLIWLLLLLSWSLLFIDNLIPEKYLLWWLDYFGIITLDAFKVWPVYAMILIVLVWGIYHSW